jgi:hypothetical protein
MKLLDDADFSQTVEICTPGEDYMYIFQQDGAISRTSKVTQEHLDEEVPEFIKKTRACRSRPIAIRWIIMCMWDSLSGKVYRGRTEKFTKEELKQRITECWEEISLAELRKSTGCFGPFVEKTEDQSIIFSPRQVTCCRTTKYVIAALQFLTSCFVFDAVDQI